MSFPSGVPNYQGVTQPVGYRVIMPSPGLPMAQLVFRFPTGASANAMIKNSPAFLFSVTAVSSVGAVTIELLDGSLPIFGPVGLGPGQVINWSAGLPTTANLSIQASGPTGCDVIIAYL